MFEIQNFVIVTINLDNRKGVYITGITTKIIY